MSDTRSILTPSGSTAVRAPGHAVLRNTYWLLALSLVPTVLGAFIGLKTGLLSGLGAGVSAIAFLGGAFAFMWMIEKNKESGAGVAWLLGFTFFMGLFLSRLLAQILGLSNGAQLIMTAFGGTALIFATMATLATTMKRSLSGMGQFLTVGAIVLLVAGLANVFFFQNQTLMLVTLVIALGLFSAFMLYDVKRVLDGGETNYISATLAIYLDIYNVFQSLLSLLGIFGGERD